MDRIPNDEEYAFIPMGGRNELSSYCCHIFALVAGIWFVGTRRYIDKEAGAYWRPSFSVVRKAIA